MPVISIGYGALSAKDELKLMKYELRDPQGFDVLIEVYFCGVCHSDIHIARSEWNATNYPCVPGHEITGVVKQVGPRVAQHRVGDRVGVGCLSSCCFECGECMRNEEQYCKHALWTYDGVDPVDGSRTRGGYGKYVIVNENWVFHIPESLRLDLASPMLCAGVTTFVPINENCRKGGMKTGVVGLGSLGHMAVQWLAKMGNEVVVITRTSSKTALAIKLGATATMLSTDPRQMEEQKDTFDYIIDTTPATRPLEDYLGLLRPRGVYTLVGLPPADQKFDMSPYPLIFQGRRIEGSLVGGIKQTKDMFEFATQNDIKPMIELIRIQDVNIAFERVIKSDVLFRFVIQIKDSLPIIKN